MVHHARFASSDNPVVFLSSLPDYLTLGEQGREVFRRKTFKQIYLFIYCVVSQFVVTVQRCLRFWSAR